MSLSAKVVAMRIPVWVKETAAIAVVKAICCWCLAPVVQSEMSEVSSVDSTSTIDNLLGIVAQVHDQMGTGMEDNTIQYGKRLLIPDLSEDDALTLFCFCKEHLQEVADKLWPRFQYFLCGQIGTIKVNNGTYSLLLYVNQK
jgi:hypothetical protein